MTPTAKTSTSMATSFWRVGKRRAGRLLDGREHNAMPAALRMSEEEE